MGNIHRKHLWIFSIYELFANFIFILRFLYNLVHILNGSKFRLCLVFCSNNLKVIPFSIWLRYLTVFTLIHYFWTANFGRNETHLNWNLNEFSYSLRNFLYHKLLYSYKMTSVTNCFNHDLWLKSHKMILTFHFNALKFS